MSAPDPLLDEIVSLLARRGGRADRARLARTLTDGYARALSLEAECSRLERQIGRLAAAADRSDDESRRELAALARTAEARADDLRRLRPLLASLRLRYAEAAAATA